MQEYATRDENWKKITYTCYRGMCYIQLLSHNTTATET